MPRPILKILAALLAVVLVIAALWTGYEILEKDYVFWNGSLLPKHDQSISISGKTMRHPEAFLKFTDLRQLDARDTGMTAEQYEWFRRELPNCTVLWDIPVQGKGYSHDTEELHVDVLTDADVHSLRYLPDLQLLDVGSWDDYPRIQAIQKQYPHCTVRYRISLSNEWWDSDVVSLALTDADEILMVEQYRYPYSEVVLEIPAGKRDGDEEPLVCGKRELKEETGATAREYRFLGELYPTPGYCGEIIYMYLATGLS